MKIAVMQPYLFPYIGYFQLIFEVDVFVSLDDVNYINRGWINRNRLLINGSAQYFTVPLLKSSQNKKIKDLHVALDEKWKRKFLKTIEFNYKNAPYYSAVKSVIEDALNFDSPVLSVFVLNTITTVLKYLGVKKRIIQSSVGFENNDLIGAERIIDICKAENCDHYINPIGGVELYDKIYFESQGVKLNFLKSKQITYKQFDEEHQPWLSIIDVLMHNPVERVLKHLEEYTLE